MAMLTFIAPESVLNKFSYLEPFISASYNHEVIFYSITFCSLNSFNSQFNTLINEDKCVPFAKTSKDEPLLSDCSAFI